MRGLREAAQLTSNPANGFKRHRLVKDRHLDAGSPVYRFLCRWGSQQLNVAEDRGLISRLPTVGELGEFLEEVLHERGAVDVDYEVGRGHASRWLPERNAQRIAFDAARYILASRTPGYIEQQRIRGRVGGSRSKRPPVVPASVFASLDQTLSIAQQQMALRELGYAVAIETVKGYRRRQRREDAG